MKLKISLTVAAFAALGVTASSFAGELTQPIIVPFDNAQITITFLSADASFTGNLIHLGGDGSHGEGDGGGEIPGIAGGAVNQLLFANHGTAAGFSVLLSGLFQEGDSLLFAYELTEVDPGESLDFFSMAVPADAPNFLYDAQTGELRIEDLRSSNPWYDGDFNDLVAQISFEPGDPVPTPGALALLGMAALLSRRRRSA